MGIIMCPGFEAAGIAAGLKKKNKKDLGLIFSRYRQMSRVCLPGTG